MAIVGNEYAYVLKFLVTCGQGVGTMDLMIEWISNAPQHIDIFDYIESLLEGDEDINKYSCLVGIFC